MNGGMDTPLWLVVLLCPIFAAVAAAYSAVGLGGGTGYVAIMVLAGLPAGLDGDVEVAGGEGRRPRATGNGGERLKTSSFLAVLIF